MTDPAPFVDSPNVVVAPGAVAGAATPSSVLRTRWLVGLVIALALLASFYQSWRADQRVRSVERELVRRQRDAESKVTEAGVFARQAQDDVRDAAARVALLQARLDEATVQRSQVDELIRSLARSRDENVVVDIEAAIRVALQQSALSGSAEPMVAALKDADERLVRINEPRLEPTRRAIARDLERLRAVSVADVPSLVMKLDEAVRMVDELPLLAAASARGEARAAARAPSASASAPPESGSDDAGGFATRPLDAVWSFVVDHIWNEAKSLVRVTRIDRPEAMLIAPEQSFFLRENMKLRLLNARLALLSRQFDTARGDLTIAQNALQRYFDGEARRTQLAGELLLQVSRQARQVSLPRPDETLAALSAVAPR